MKFSLVLATLGRINEVEEFIKSLLNQSYKNYELIIVDQNSHNEVEKIYELYKDKIEMKYLKIDEPGLSNARNIGIKHCEGDVISFPDDDCEYDKETLNNVYKKFKSTENDIITFKIIDKYSKQNTCGNWLDSDTIITKSNIFNTAISITIFVRKKSSDNLEFDLNLGVGTRLSSGEETDFILNLIDNGYKGTYFSDIYVYHPQKEKNFSRGYNYALGTGAVYYKEIIQRKNYLYSIKYLKSIVGTKIRIFKNFIKKDTNLLKYNKAVLRGRIEGFFAMSQLYKELK